MSLLPCPTQEANSADEWCTYGYAGKQGDMAMLRCLRRLRYPVRPPVLEAAATYECCPVEVLEWMVDQGFPADWEQVEDWHRGERPEWRGKWSERSAWVHRMWCKAQARRGM